MLAYVEQKEDSKADIKKELFEIIDKLSVKNLMRLLYSARGLQNNGE